MKKILALLALFLAFPACSGLAVRSGAGNKITFIETNNAGQQVRHLSFVLTQKRANTCIAGNWKRAKPVNDTSAYTKDPAYRLDQGKLEILLVNQVCDSYNSYVGELSDRQFHGEHVVYGLDFNRTLGNVTGTYTAK